MGGLGFATVIYLVALYSTWVVLPLLPAVITFWLFPKTTVTATGPLSNLTVNASGAFAAYLIVFLASYPLVDAGKITIVGLQRQFWTVRIPIVLVDAHGNEKQSEDLINKLKVLRPAQHVVEKYDNASKSYHATIKITEDAGRLPRSLVIDIPGFGSGIVERQALQSAEDTDYYRKEIELKKAVRISQPAAGGIGRVVPSSERQRQ